MNQNKLRIGNPTSSEIVALTTKGKDGKSFGKPAKTYIAECNMERRLGRSISADINARPLQWGKLVEKRAFNLLGTDYILTSKETDQHPTIPYWAGSKDAHKEDDGRTVCDIKCPITLKSFCGLVDPLYNGLEGIDAMNALREGWADKQGNIYDKHSDGEKYYWQLVSNGIINDCRFAELIVYVPFQKELSTIKQMALDSDDSDKLYWITTAKDDDLPYLKNVGYYKNINIIRFEIPQDDKDYLTDCIERAGKLLITV